MATLIAINVGMPRDVPWRGATVHTGVWKETVTGPRLVRRLNVDGDGQGDLAGHGGEHRAVLVYQVDSYAHWQTELGRADLVHGIFGENFTVDGLPDDEVCIGDRYRIGGAEFEVTQPRVTCYRVGLRLNEPRMAALLVSHHRPGFYMRVLTEGEVRAGDEIVKIASGPEAMTVAEIDALLYLPDRQRERLPAALRIPALSPGWKASLQALLDQPPAGGVGPSGNPGLTDAASSPPPAWSGFRSLQVVDVAPESTSISSFRLAAADGLPLPRALAGQFLTVRLPAETGSTPLIRSYSLSGLPGASEYRISVKREAHGMASAYLHTRVRVGDLLEVAAPRGSFTLRAGDGPVLLLSAGVGATPVLAMLHQLVAEHSTRQVWWLHGARDGSQHPFVAEVRALVAALADGHSHVWYSAPASGDVQGRDYDTRGRLSTTLFAQLGVPRDADAYLCGPAGFMQEVTASLIAFGVDRARIRTEIFGAGPALTPGVVNAAMRPPHLPEGVQGTGPAVSFARSGITTSWDSRYASLLELAEACDVPTRWSCRTGVCHNCESGLLAGAVAYTPEPVEPPAAGNLLICCSQPRGDVILDL